MIGIMSDAQTVQRIHKLPKILANQIAAGEVIERPASVVKELLENSLDARASEITVNIEKGGTQLIRVIDNGQGIHPDDLVLAIDRHTTSKLHSQSDLEHIVSLGFRGEALSSIAAVSRCKLSSRQNDHGHGFVIDINHRDHSPKIYPAAHPAGTTVEVRDLFFNTPGRRKFLRSCKTEFLHIQELVRRIALSQYNTVIRLSHDNRSIFYCSSSQQDPEQRVLTIFGQEFLKNAVSIDYTNSGLRLWGWSGRAEVARSHSDRQYFYLNGRIIRDKQVNHAIRMAYHDLLHPGRYPSYVLYLEMDAAAIDVNVHPNKHEVRFREARNVHDFIHHSLSRILHEEISHPTALRVHDSQSVGQYDHSSKGKKTYLLDEEQESYTRSFSLLQGRFIIIDDGDELVLINTHRARELILNVRLQRKLAAGGVRSRPLLVPITIPISEQDAELLESHDKILAELGIGVEQISPDALSVREIPVLLGHADIMAMISDVIDALKTAGQPISGKQLIACLTKHANDALDQSPSASEINQLLENLREIENKISKEDFQNALRVLDTAALKNLFK